MIDPTDPEYANTPASDQRPAYGYGPADPTAPPAATIVTPFYNTGPIFHETARSVMRQSFQQWEWLIVNDGSTQADAVALLNEYRAREARIRVIDHGYNRGLSAARNTGFQAARTPYVIQLDSDDLLEPTAIEKCLWFLESYPEYAFAKGYTVGFEAQTYLWQHGFHSGQAFLQENRVAASSVVRTAVHRAVGGYDRTFQSGFEDWDFWLRCASQGHWGGTLPEYLDWYRRRESHQDRWADWNQPQQVKRQLRQRYPRLWAGQFPHIQPEWHRAYTRVPDHFPWNNRLEKDKPRLLMILPWLTVGGADKFNLDALELLTGQGWEVSIAATLTGDSSWLPEFARFTPDIFVLPHFLRLTDYPRFLCALIHSRQVDVVMISNSEFAYLLLPYLRSRCPGVAFVDYCHMEEEAWKSGGYPRLAVAYQDMLDLNIVSSRHLRHWMEKRGADAERIQVCYTNVDAEKWRPTAAASGPSVRRALDIADDTPLLLYAARICEQKQPRVFAQSLLRLRQTTTDWAAVVAGDGPEAGWLGGFIKRHRLGRHVRLLGAVPNDSVRQLMVEADIFFLPSQWEGIALSVYEAMACGLPVVGADVGGQRELVTPECGVLIARATPEAEAETYAAALAELIAQPARRHRMGQAGRQRVQSAFRLEDLATRLEQLFREAQHRHTTQPRPMPHPSLARICAGQAVEYTRLTSVAEELWQERGQARSATPGLSPLGSVGLPGVPWRTRLYFALRRLLFPSYRLAMNHRWGVRLKDTLKRFVLGPGHTG